jgi:RimJ/RimL family protein N-acetyltransferase
MVPSDCFAADESELPLNFTGGRLRRMRAADLAAFQTYRRLPELGRYQSWSPMSDAEALAFLADMADAPMFMPGQWMQIGIAELESDLLIGDIGIYLSDDALSSEIGFALEPGAQGRGIATAAVREALGVIFARTAVTQILGITDSRNLASVRLLERLGFVHQETREVTFRGEPCSEKIYALPRNNA